MKKLTEAQKATRAANRIKFKRKHFELVRKGDKAQHDETRKHYYREAHEAYLKFKANGGRD